MLSYSFADLLYIFFRLNQDPLQRKTQADLARELGVSPRTVAGWFAGDYAPRTAEVVLQLAHALSLTTFQTDLLLYAIQPGWVKYGTPAQVLEATELIRYREASSTQPASSGSANPSLAQIEADWQLHFADDFRSNYQRWGVGVKENGMCRLTRQIEGGCYRLALQNLYHDDVFMGGDSNCFAPPRYYVSVQAQMVQGGTADDGYGLMFEELNDERFGLLRIRETMRRASVVQTVDGGHSYQIYANQASAAAVRPGQINQLALLVLQDEYWFYVNRSLIQHCVIPRLQHGRLDVAIVAGQGQCVVCHFQDFRLLVP